MLYDYKRVAPRTSSNPCIYVVDTTTGVCSVDQWSLGYILWRQKVDPIHSCVACGGHVPAQTPELGVQQMTHVTASPKFQLN